MNEVNTSTCDAFTSEQYLTTCGQVCVDAPVTGSGGGNGGGLGGGSGAGTATATAFCTTAANLTCDRAFECIPATSRTTDFTDSYGATIAACKAMTPATCVDSPAQCPTYSASAGATCVSALGSAACADIVLFDGIFPPLSCLSTCP